jgi:K+-transporting ATPase ATPase C chain
MAQAAAAAASRIPTDLVAAAASRIPTDLVAAAASRIPADLVAAAASRIPADLVAASGSGLDPHITLAAALYQADEVAAARGLPAATVRDILHRCAARPLFASEPLIPVLLVNMALDRADK